LSGFFRQVGMVQVVARALKDQEVMSRFAYRSALKAAVLVSSAAIAAPVLAQQPAQSPRPAQPGGQQRPAGQQPAQPAQPGAAPAAVQLKGDPNQNVWTKVCGRDPASQRETCYTTRDFVAENDTPVLAVAVYETKGEGNRVDRQVRYLMPLTFLLQPGVRSSIDGGQPIPGRYTICVQNGCFAEFTVNDQQFRTLKGGRNLTIQVQNQAAREVSFVLPLDGFAAGIDGPPIDPRALEEQQRKLQEELQRRSDEMRRQMQGGGGAPAPGTAPGAAPAPGAVPAPGVPAAPAAPGVPAAPRQ
jgi:invasion protein IalB